MIRFTFTFTLLLSIIHLGYCRFIPENINLISDGINERNQTLLSSTVTCEPIYGFLPCTTSLWGQLFLIVVYEYLLFLGEKYVSAGSDLFFQMIGPGIFGASLFHILGTIPQIMLVLVSGLSASTSAAEEQAAMGMGLLAGSAVMLLTIVWGTCVALSSIDLSGTSTSSKVEHNNRAISLTGFGVVTDVETSSTAKIMILSMIPFLLLQVPKIINSSSVTRVIVLVSLIVTLALLVAYGFYQVFQPWIQDRRFDYLAQKYVKDKLLRLLTKNGKPNIPLMKQIFHEIDKNKNGYISRAEIRVLILRIEFEEEGSIRDDYLEEVMEAFDLTGDSRISEEEFVTVLMKWLTEAKKSVTSQDQRPFKFFRRRTVEKNGEEQQNLVVKRKKSPTADKSLSNYLIALFQVLLGTAILAVLARPLIVAVGSFSTAASIPSFLVPYVVIPFAMNYRQTLSMITSARKKTLNSISLTLSEIYGAVFMSNLIGLTAFLALVYIRDLSWDVSAEVLVVLIICTAMGLFTSFRTKFQLWTGVLACLLYPVSLLLLYIFTVVLGWE